MNSQENSKSRLFLQVFLTLQYRLQLEALAKAAQYFRKGGMYQYAIETYLKMGDNENLLDIYIDRQMWDEAMKLIVSEIIV